MQTHQSEATRAKTSKATEETITCHVKGNFQLWWQNKDISRKTKLRKIITGRPTLLKRKNNGMSSYWNQGNQIVICLLVKKQSASVKISMSTSLGWGRPSRFHLYLSICSLEKPGRPICVVAVSYSSFLCSPIRYDSINI